jgi:hypothetical protein
MACVYARIIIEGESDPAALMPAFNEYPQRQLRDRSCPTYYLVARVSGNTPSGSWGIVQIGLRLSIDAIRLDLKDSPTSVGGY